MARINVKRRKLEPPITKSQARKLLMLGGRKTSKEEVNRFMTYMKSGVPVMPVKFFCDFLREWQHLYETPVPEEIHPDENKERREKGEKIGWTFIQLTKSNFLWRRIYGGQATRTKPCPVHKGRWSGCKLPEDTECKGACMDGSNVTGWLP